MFGVNSVYKKADYSLFCKKDPEWMKKKPKAKPAENRRPTEDDNQMEPERD